MTLEEWYVAACTTHSDIFEHLPTLNDLASECKHVTEIGTGPVGNSTLALLHAQPDVLITYDIEDKGPIHWLLPIKGRTNLSQIIADSLRITIEPTDFLFIDSRHTYYQLKTELALHADKARKIIAFHDTDIYGKVDEEGGPGLMVAINEFLVAHPEWVLTAHFTNDNGFTVIRRK